MITQNELGKYVLSQEVTGIIRRIPIESRGVSRTGREWVLGKVVLEVYEEGKEGSAQIYLTTFDEELTEMIQMLGVGKRVKAVFHIGVREFYDSYSINLILDSISGMNENEDYVYGTKKGETK